MTTLTRGGGEDSGSSATVRLAGHPFKIRAAPQIVRPCRGQTLSYGVRPRLTRLTGSDPTPPGSGPARPVSRSGPGGRFHEHEAVSATHHRGGLDRLDAVGGMGTVRRHGHS